ncbi:major facilitator superfamily transporter [Colletotrichum kahawae]|uniref:Major facilitator superfamily transporter n=1 Tax=Colletotrichum kahawae TaxID=34407 RepID=A0AAE0D152_COLKA|nr:major facilitator superfamily transporter [Colletotrichum kahawae]
MGPEKVSETQVDGTVDMIETKEAHSQNRLAPAQLMSQEEFEEAEKKLKKKLDLRLLACVWLIFVLNYLDRNNIAAAKVAGMAETLHLSANQYATAVPILFVGYVLMQIPSNVFLANLRPSIYLPACMTMWGLLSTLTGIAHNAADLYALRFFLGFVEAAFYPGALFLISSWYRRSEMGLRSAILFSATQLGSAFSGLIGAGTKDGLEGARGLESWRWLFLIEGSITIFVALCSIFRAVAEWRLIQDAGQVDEDEEAWSHGFKLAFKDWRVYVFAAMFFCLQVAAAKSNFFLLLLQLVKRAAAVAFVNAFGNISQVWTSYLYPDADKPRYGLAMSVNSAFALGTIILALAMRIILQRANKKLDSGADVAEVMKGESQAQVVGISEEDREASRARFRYVLRSAIQQVVVWVS